MKNRTKKITIVALAVFAFLAKAWILSPLYLPWEVLYRGELKTGDKIILSIENFKVKNNRLPNPEIANEVVPPGFELRIGYYPDYKII